MQPTIGHLVWARIPREPLPVSGEIVDYIGAETDDRFPGDVFAPAYLVRVQNGTTHVVNNRDVQVRWEASIKAAASKLVTFVQEGSK